MQEKLIAIEKKYWQIEAKLADPACYNDPEAVSRLTREQKELQPVAEKVRELRKLEGDMASAEELLRSEDGELRALAKEELAEGSERLAALREAVRRQLLKLRYPFLTRGEDE